VYAGLFVVLATTDFAGPVASRFLAATIGTGTVFAVAAAVATSPGGTPWAPVTVAGGATGLASFAVLLVADPDAGALVPAGLAVCAAVTLAAARTTTDHG
jgi:hypothetical protein